MKTKNNDYLEEARQNFSDRMLSQNSGPLTEEEKRQSEINLKELEEYRKKMNKEN
ncbi:MAG: hypothetical protein Q4B36_05105 [Tissierellia bacterium]|nr:hypothetical protein [Tissierellia bacterium]